MIAVIFEVEPRVGQQEAYLKAAERLGPLLARVDGFISIERFESLTAPGRILSLSYWRDEEAVRHWRNDGEHRQVQSDGREFIFANYRLHVAHVLRDYGMQDREQAPGDSRELHDGIQVHPQERRDDANAGDAFQAANDVDLEISAIRDA